MHSWSFCKTATVAGGTLSLQFPDVASAVNTTNLTSRKPQPLASRAKSGMASLRCRSWIKFTIHN